MKRHRRSRLPFIISLPTACNIGYEKGDSGFWVLLTLRYKRGYEIQKEITIDSFVFHDSHILRVEKEPDFTQSLFVWIS